MKNKKPNVIFILADDLGWGELGCYGNSFNETPHIDALAKDGIRFTTAYASSTVCSPSRAGLMTGQAPPRNGITDYLRPNTEWRLPLNPFIDNELPEDTDYRMDPNMITLAQMFKLKSYNTGIIGKWHLSGYDEKGVKFGPTKYGFDEAIISEQVGIADGSYFWPYNKVDLSIQPRHGATSEYLVDRMNEEAVDFIHRHKDQPFFLYLSHYAVHTTLAGKEADVRYFAEKEDAGQSETDDLAWIQQNNPVLAAMLRSIDDGVGMIRETLLELGLDQNTLIIFTSDNGGESRITVNGHLREGKSTTYEGGLRIPLAMSWPQVISKEKECHEPTINLDFYSTFAEIIGYDIPDHHVMDGVSIAPLMWADEATLIPAPLRERSFYWHYPLEKPHFLGGRSSAAHRDGEWKFIQFFDDASQELYNLRTDEEESEDLSQKKPDMINKLDQEMKTWLDTVGADIPSGG